MNLHSILVNGVVFKDDQVLIAQRSFEEKHEPGKWTVPGGKVELTQGNAHHILQKTVAREILEETGIEVEQEMQLISNNTFLRSPDNQHVVAIVFKCQYKSGEAKPLEDTIGCKWVTQEEVEGLEFPPNVKEYILEAFKVYQPS